ncbi:hypothetical protein Tco_0933690 [Tanacetum coccineum]
MEDDFKPAIQNQRSVNLKIHEVIKKEVIKLLDAGLIYPISDSPWVSPVHCVPKKGGMTVVENEDNELIPTRLVTGWRVCIDYPVAAAVAGYGWRIGHHRRGEAYKTSQKPPSGGVGRRYSHHSRTLWCRAVMAQPHVASRGG